MDVPTSNNTSASFSQIPTTHFFFTNTLFFLVLPVLPNISTDEKFTFLTLDVSSSFVSRSHHGSANRGNYPDTWQRAKRIFSFNDKLSTNTSTRWPLPVFRLIDDSDETSTRNNMHTKQRIIMSLDLANVSIFL